MAQTRWIDEFFNKYIREDEKRWYEYLKEEKVKLKHFYIQEYGAQSWCSFGREKTRRYVEKKIDGVIIRISGYKYLDEIRFALFKFVERLDSWIMITDRINYDVKREKNGQPIISSCQEVENLYWVKKNYNQLFYIICQAFLIDDKTKQLKKDIHNELLYSPNLPFYKENISKQTKQCFGL